MSEVQGLRVEHWHQWEQLCIHRMQQLVAQNLDKDVKYQTYGSRGQSQFGIDLVPINSDLPVVGQCKLKESSFTWDMLLKELCKTDNYAGSIKRYILFTTASPHWSIQDQQNLGQYRHTRPDGTTFAVQVVNWKDFPALETFIPNDVLQQIFPAAFKLARVPEILPQPDFRRTLEAMKSHIPTRISAADLGWLEQWDFSKGYVHEKDYEPFEDLWRDWRDVQMGRKHSRTEWMYQDKLRKIGDCLPAADNFFRALDEFRNSISGQSIGETLNDGVNALSVRDKPAAYQQKVTRQWRMDAEYLAAVYRRDVLDQASSD